MIRTRLRPGLWSLAALLAACAGEPIAAPRTGSADAAEEPAGTHPADPPIDPAMLAQQTEKIALVPSPMETQRALEAAGITTRLSTLIARRELDMSVTATDRVAVRTGVVLADLLLGTKHSTDEELVSRLDRIGKGMAQLGAGSEIQEVLKSCSERIETDAVSRDELLKELDELVVSIPGLAFEGSDRVIPLIEAGSWLEGANLVARAIQATPGSQAAADKLLKQPSVVEHFARYVKTEGAPRAPEAVTRKLEETLATLKGLAEKPEPLTDADIDTVVTVTGDVLALL